MHFTAGHDPAEIAEIVRRKRLDLESLPADRYPNLVAMAGPMVGGADPALYDSFGVDLVLGGIEALAARS
ncbi:hypothetical protein AB0C18_25260 [Nonomuraea muscovyensis]|uniref:hypothetical protein n=1 Tax=Nonomuraea muscovyensis TaxID=1124761 RepID=UPI0033F05168